jgi:hypothetical protein
MPFPLPSNLGQIFFLLSPSPSSFLLYTRGPTSSRIWAGPHSSPADAFPLPSPSLTAKQTPPVRYLSALSLLSFLPTAPHKKPARDSNPLRPARIRASPAPPPGSPCLSRALASLSPFSHSRYGKWCHQGLAMAVILAPQLLPFPHSPAPTKPLRHISLPSL